VKKGYGNLYSEKVNKSLLMNVAESDTMTYNATVVKRVPLEFLKYLPPLDSVFAGKGKPPSLLDISILNNTIKQNFWKKDYQEKI
jgi:hypothetical protein